MNTSFHLDFRILEQKSARGCCAVPSEWIQTDTAGRTKRAGPRNRLFGFRNRKFAALPYDPEMEYEYLFREGTNPGKRCRRT